jgi:transcriptional repressor NrdR
MMRCPFCSSQDDRVVDSRVTDEGAAIRRRRECASCRRRYTTFERVEAALWVVKRDGRREPFDRSKVVGGVELAIKNLPVSEDEVDDLAAQVEEEARAEGEEVPSALVGEAVMRRLRSLDEVAYVRFASVHKGFTDRSDFAREVGLLEPSSTSSSPSRS